MAAKLLKKIVGSKIRPWWGLLGLLALVMTDPAHAPRISGASASTGRNGAGNPTSTDIKTPAVTDIAATPSTAWIDPSAIQKALKDLNEISPSDPPTPANKAISLVPTQPDDSTISGFDGGDGISETGPAYTIPSPFQPTVYTGGSGIDFSPVPGTVTGPVLHNPLTVTTEIPVQVPEPGIMSVLLSGWMLLARRPSKAKLGQR